MWGYRRISQSDSRSRKTGSDRSNDLRERESRVILLDIEFIEPETVGVILGTLLRSLRGRTPGQSPDGASSLLPDTPRSPSSAVLC